MSDGSRQHAQEQFQRAYGVDAGTAALVAVALHPLVTDAPQPASSSFTKMLRKDSRRFASRSRGVAGGDELRELARATVQHWARRARHLGEEYYARELLEALDEAGRPGETEADVFGDALSPLPSDPRPALRPADRAPRSLRIGAGTVGIALLKAVVYSLPIYLLVAAIAEGVTVTPNETTELLILAGIVAVAAIPQLLAFARDEVGP